MTHTVVDLFAGPGGASLGILAAGYACVGIELDGDACATAHAAGLDHVQADVVALDPREYAGADGLWASPPCQAWSAAGKRTAKADQARLGRHVERCRTHGEWVPYDVRHYADARTPLVLEPVRWVAALTPRWVALEQVPPVLDLWRHYADLLRAWGYHAWAGVLNAADYGVPQTRERAILMARRDGPVAPPEPTHAKHPEPATLFGDERLPWVTMAEALDWPEARWGWVRPDGEHRSHTTTEPAPTVCGHRAPQWQPRQRDGGYFVAAGQTGEGRPRDPEQSPAATVSGKGTAYWVNGNQAHSAVRRADEPAPTIHFAERLNDVKWVRELPSPTITTSRRSDEGGMVGHQLADPDDARNVGGWGWNRRDQTGTDEVDHDWPEQRPATTVAGRGLVPDPGANANRYNGAEKSRNDGVRVSVEEAAVLQSFPPDWPWQGTKTSRFGQVGNAVPPLLAEAICRALT